MPRFQANQALLTKHNAKDRMTEKSKMAVLTEHLTPGMQHLPEHRAPGVACGHDTRPPRPFVGVGKQSAR